MSAAALPLTRSNLTIQSAVHKRDKFLKIAQAPHWVDGYHDIVFDAMDRMEGAEIRPTKEIYETIIYAFSRCGDTVAAEFYFWEMKRKGMTASQVKGINNTPSPLPLFSSPHLTPPPLQCHDSGLRVDRFTYSRLLFGFARAQSIGAQAYGTSGRTSYVTLCGYVAVIHYQ
jgi:pentatricopeptide repeat protein